MGKGKSFLGWAIGLLTGTAVGVLFAPRKGKEFRDRIKKARRQGKVGHEPVLEDMKHLGEEMMVVAKDAYEASVLRDMIEKWRKDLRALSEDLVDDAQDFHKEALKPAIKDAQKKAKWAMRRAKSSKHIVKKAVSEFKREFKK